MLSHVESCIFHSPSPCNFSLELAHRKAVCVLEGTREAAVIIFWRLSLDAEVLLSPSLFALLSFLMLALPKVTRSPPDTLLTTHRGGSHEEPTTFHRLRGLTFWLPELPANCESFVTFPLPFNNIFLDLYLPSSSHNCVSRKSYHTFLLLYDSWWFCFSDWIFFKAITKVYFQTELLKNPTFYTQNFYQLELFSFWESFSPWLPDSDYWCRMMILMCPNRRNCQDS